MVVPEFPHPGPSPTLAVLGPVPVHPEEAPLPRRPRRPAPGWPECRQTVLAPQQSPDSVTPWAMAPSRAPVRNRLIPGTRSDHSAGGPCRTHERPAARRSWLALRPAGRPACPSPIRDPPNLQPIQDSLRQRLRHSSPVTVTHSAPARAGTRSPAACVVAIRPLHLRQRRRLVEPPPSTAALPIAERLQGRRSGEYRLAGVPGLRPSAPSHIRRARVRSSDTALTFAHQDEKCGDGHLGRIHRAGGASRAFPRLLPQFEGSDERNTSRTESPPPRRRRPSGAGYGGRPLHRVRPRRAAAPGRQVAPAPGEVALEKGAQIQTVPDRIGSRPRAWISLTNSFADARTRRRRISRGSQMSRR